MLGSECVDQRVSGLRGEVFAGAKHAQDRYGLRVENTSRYAIDFSLLLFDVNGFEGTRSAIDVSSDGPNNSGGYVDNARDKAIAAGVTVNGLPILDESGGAYSWYSIPDLDLYYRDCVIGGPAAFMVVAASFQERSIASPTPVFMPSPPVGTTRWTASPARNTRSRP